MKSLNEYIQESSNDEKVEVGTIFVVNDYYNDITDWYRVTKLVGNKSVKLEKLEKKATSGGGYVHSGECKPILDKPGKEINKTFRIGPDNSIRISQYDKAYIWDGKEGRWNLEN